MHGFQTCGRHCLVFPAAHARYRALPQMAQCVCEGGRSARCSTTLQTILIRSGDNSSQTFAFCLHVNSISVLLLAIVSALLRSVSRIRLRGSIARPLEQPLRSDFSGRSSRICRRTIEVICSAYTASGRGTKSVSQRVGLLLYLLRGCNATPRKACASRYNMRRGGHVRANTSLGCASAVQPLCFAHFIFE